MSFDIRPRPLTMRATVWRKVRDAGSVGVTAARACELLNHLAKKDVQVTLCQLKLNGFLKQGERLTPYFVDEDCKVPEGEHPSLGPGMGEDRTDEPLEANLPRAVDAVLPANCWPFGMVAADVAAGPGYSGDPKPASADFPLPWPANLLPIAYAPVPVLVPMPRSFRSTLSNDGTLTMQLRAGKDVELDAQETRELFAWLDRMRRSSLQELLPEVAS